MKYIDADCLRKAVEKKYNSNDTVGDRWDLGYDTACEQILEIIDSLQQDEKALELEMCSQSYWEDMGWIMIPPSVTLKGIETLLKQVRKKLQQDQPEVDLDKEIETSIRLLNGLHTLEDNKSWYKGMYEELKELARHFYELGKNSK